MNALTILTICIISKVDIIQSEGIMILYRPKDITDDCVNSHLLRYDLSFGMGLSDTITVMFRTLDDINYECSIEFVTEPSTVIIVVIKYPNLIAVNCEKNKHAFTVVFHTECHTLCEAINYHNTFTFNYILRTLERIQMRFSSNNTINNNMNAYLYQVTATTAREPHANGACYKSNETTCVIKGKKYCFTNGVVCDGIKNCGVEDWYDEKKSECGLPHAQLNKMAVVAVTAAFFLAVLAVGHWILKCLPPVANSFFIFHSNEDNRLYIQPVYKPSKDGDSGTGRVMSNAAMSGSSSESDNPNKLQVGLGIPDSRPSEDSVEKTHSRRTTTMKAVASRLQEKFWSVAGRSAPPRAAHDA